MLTAAPDTLKKSGCCIKTCASVMSSKALTCETMTPVNEWVFTLSGTMHSVSQEVKQEVKQGANVGKMQKWEQQEKEGVPFIMVVVEANVDVTFNIEEPLNILNIVVVEANILSIQRNGLVTKEPRGANDQHQPKDGWDAIINQPKEIQNQCCETVDPAFVCINDKCDDFIHSLKGDTEWDDMTKTKEFGEDGNYVSLNAMHCNPISHFFLMCRNQATMRLIILTLF